MKRNRFILFLIFIATYIYAANVGGTISYLLLYMVLFIPMLSIFYLAYVFCRFRIYQSLERKVLVKGDHVPYEFHLTNEDIIAFTHVRVTLATKTSSVDAIDTDTSYCLLPSERIVKKTTLCGHYRGQYYVGIDSVIVRDFFNLFELKYSQKEKIEVQVLPRVLHLSNLAIAPNEENLKNNLQGEANKQVIRDNELRKYQSGDSMKLVHWKASARNRTLLCQKYIDEPKTEILSILDLSQNDRDEYEKIVIEDKMIESVLAIHQYFYSHGIPSRVMYADAEPRVKAIRTKQEFDEFYNTCKSLWFHSEYTVTNLLLQAIRVAEDTGYLIFITANLNDKICVACNEVVRYGLDVTILLVGDDDLSMQKRLLSEKIHLYIIHLDDDVETVLSERRGQI